MKGSKPLLSDKKYAAAFAAAGKRGGFMIKKITLRLYRYQDYDLMTLYYRKKFSFGRHVKEALFAYATGHDYQIMMPDTKMTKENYPVKMQCQILLDTEKQRDMEIINLLVHVIKKQTNGFVKGVVRKFSLEYTLKSYTPDINIIEIEAKHEKQMMPVVPEIKTQKISIPDVNPEPVINMPEPVVIIPVIEEKKQDNNSSNDGWTFDEI